MQVITNLFVSVFSSQAKRVSPEKKIQGLVYLVRDKIGAVSLKRVIDKAKCEIKRRETALTNRQ
ncbi:hypothetical protein RyT2_28720 [Pseudolactococcus yaeyamensis]